MATGRRGAEELLYDDNMGQHVRAVFGFIGFVHNPAVREVIFKLHQHDWRVVPPETKEQCKTAFKGLGHSLGNERGFKVTKDWKRTNSRKHVIKRIRRLYIPIQKKIIGTFCKRPEVSCGVSTPVCVRKKYPVPENRFEALAGEPSFCEKKSREGVGPLEIIGGQRQMHKVCNSSRQHGSCYASAMRRTAGIGFHSFG